LSPALDRFDYRMECVVVGADEELIFRVSAGTAEPLKGVGLAEIGYKERQHLQDWVEANPEIVGRGLLLVTAEFDRWRFGAARVADRLDLLFLTSDGAPLVAELKRGEAPDTVDLQALKYAAYCSQLTVEDVVEAYGAHRKVGIEEARADVFEHAPSLAEDGLGPVRVRLVAEGFRPSVTTMVMWMHQELGLDVGCVRVTARRLPDGSAVVSSRLILPPPAAEDYLVGVRRREGEQEERIRRERTARRPNAVPRLLEAGVPAPGAELVLRLDTFTQKEQDLVGVLLESDPSAGEAEWTGTTANSVLKWRKDGKPYSASLAIVKVLQLAGARPEAEGGSAHGPRHWEVVGDGRTLWELAESLLDTDPGPAFPPGPGSEGEG